QETVIIKVGQVGRTSQAIVTPVGPGAQWGAVPVSRAAPSQKIRPTRTLRPARTPRRTPKPVPAPERAPARRRGPGAAVRCTGPGPRTAPAAARPGAPPGR